jgi:hypothetical protein
LRALVTGKLIGKLLEGVGNRWESKNLSEPSHT